MASTERALGLQAPAPAARLTPARLAAFGLAALVFAVLPLVLPTYQVSLATQILIYAVLAMSIDVLAGFAGRTSLCHGAIFGTATYVVLYTVTVAQGPLWLAMLLGVLAATPPSAKLPVCRATA